MELLILPVAIVKKVVELYPKRLNVVGLAETKSVDPSLCKNFLKMDMYDFNDDDIENIKKIEGID